MEETTPNPDGEDKPPVPGREPSIAGAVEFLSLGLSIAVLLAGGALLGYLVDRWLGTVPLFTLVGLALGIATAAFMTIARVRKYL
jgi:F0F1-type ATP synthase assembly protein I